MHKWFNVAVLLLAGIVAMAGCSTGITHTVTVGFGHTEALLEAGETENTGWGIGGTVGFELEGSGLSAVEICGAGAFEFGETNVEDDGDLAIYSNRIPLSLCSKFDT